MVLAGIAATALAACEPISLDRLRGGGGGSIDTSAPVPVALLIPSSEEGGGAAVARGLENAARLAIADLQGATIDLRVYDTGGNPAQAAAVTEQAISEGAGIILGPLYTQTTVAATRVAAARGVNLLSFSNNTAVAGGSTFILGQTFDDIANRLTAYAARQGRRDVVIVHADDVAGRAGQAAIARAAQANGMTVRASESYALSQEAIREAGPRIGNTVTSSGASAVFLTANIANDLPLIASTLPQNGVDPATYQYLGLTRWNTLPQALSLRGLQGGWFVLPDQSISDTFEGRYRSAYGTSPHPLAGLAYDGIQAIGSLVAGGRGDALTAGALTQNAGFAGATGVFRFLPNGTNERGLAVAEVRDNRVVVIDPAPRRFGGFGL